MINNCKTGNQECEVKVSFDCGQSKEARGGENIVLARIVTKGEKPDPTSAILQSIRTNDAGDIGVCQSMKTKQLNHVGDIPKSDCEIKFSKGLN